MDNKIDITKGHFLYLSCEAPVNYYNSIKKKISNKGRKGLCSNRVFEDTFYSNNNISIIQSMLKEEIKRLTCNKYTIVNQDTLQLEEIMRYVYDMYGQALPFKEKEQMLELDRKVVHFAAETAILNIQHKARFLHRQFNPLDVSIPEPINDSVKGRKLTKTNLEEDVFKLDNVTEDETSIYNRKLIIPENNTFPF